MALISTGKSGRKTQFDTDDVTGLLTQDPESTESSQGGLDAATANVAFGVPITILAYLSQAMVHTTPATETVTIFDANCPWQCRVIDFKFDVLDATTAEFDEEGSLTCTLTDGTNDIIADQDISAIEDGGCIARSATVGIIVPAYAELAADDSLVVAMTGVCDDESVGATVIGLAQITLVRVR